VIKNVFGAIMQASPVIRGKPRSKGSKKLRVSILGLGGGELTKHIIFIGLL